MAQTVFETLANKLTEDVAGITLALTNGRAETYDEYRFMVGRIRGLSAALQHIEDLAANYLEDE